MGAAKSKAAVPLRPMVKVSSRAEGRLADPQPRFAAAVEEMRREERGGGSGRARREPAPRRT